MLVWDLREGSALHHQLKEGGGQGEGGEGEELRRAPTFCSQGVHNSRCREMYLTSAEFGIQ